MGWSYNHKAKFFEYHSPDHGDALIYDIGLKQLNTPEWIAFWVSHLEEKIWGRDSLDAFLDLLAKVLSEKRNKPAWEAVAQIITARAQGIPVDAVSRGVS